MLPLIVSVCLPHQTLSSSRTEGKECILILNSHSPLGKMPGTLQETRKYFWKTKMQGKDVKKEERKKVQKAIELGSREVGI
jgi:hypothetical protein